MPLVTHWKTLKNCIKMFNTQLSISRQGALLASVFVTVCSGKASREYLYYPNSDVTSTAETLYPQSNLTDPFALAALCDSIPGCIGFNTDGWLKNASSSLAPTPVDVYLLAPNPVPAPPPSLWPMPQSVSVGQGRLVVTSSLDFQASTPCADLTAAFARTAAKMFNRGSYTGAHAASRLGLPTLATLVVSVANVSVPLDLGVDESYTLTLPTDGSAASLTANTVYGAYHGLETLSQLVSFDADALAYWTASPVAVVDKPAFAWRGLMVDPARQFLPMVTLHAIIDSMSFAKLNSLHMHILDCDSFPIQIPAPWQSLWQAAFSPRERYTLADLSSLVEYGRQRGVRVIYEFDQPGHAGSMCKAYPSLCPTPSCGSTMDADVLDPSYPGTLAAMRAVVNTLAQASIDSVLHLGGDEVHPGCWLSSPSVLSWMAAHNISSGDGVYEYFVAQSNAMALQAGKSPMRWEEVWNHFGTALDPRTIVHAWLSVEGLVNASNHGYRTVFSVNSAAYYLDYLNLQWSDVYGVDVLAGVTNASALPYILGGEMCAWGETMDAGTVLQVVWPRAAAGAERLWSYNFNTSTAQDWATITRLSAFRCLLWERGIPAGSLGNAQAGELRRAWTVGSCAGGYKQLC